MRQRFLPPQGHQHQCATGMVRRSLSVIGRSSKASIITSEIQPISMRVEAATTQHTIQTIAILSTPSNLIEGHIDYIVVIVLLSTSVSRP